VRTTWLAPLVLAAVAFLASVDGQSGITMWFRLRDDVALSATRVDNLARETEDLKDQIEALENEPFALERAIREDLELARPGEIIVRFDRNGGRDG
jgi:cell division protein FtsB